MAWDWDKLQQQRKGASPRNSSGRPRIDEVFEKIRGAKGKCLGVILVIIMASCGEVDKG